MKTERNRRWADFLALGTQIEQLDKMDGRDRYDCLVAMTASTVQRVTPPRAPRAEAPKATDPLKLVDRLVAAIQRSEGCSECAARAQIFRSDDNLRLRWVDAMNQQTR